MEKLLKDVVFSRLAPPAWPPEQFIFEIAPNARGIGGSFGFQIKIAYCNFYLSAAAKMRFRLASRNASHFGATSCPRIPIPGQKLKHF
jgi:hypothetical protein